MKDINYSNKIMIFLKEKNIKNNFAGGLLGIKTNSFTHKKSMMNSGCTARFFKQKDYLLILSRYAKYINNKISFFKKAKKGIVEINLSINNRFLASNLRDEFIKIIKETNINFRKLAKITGFSYSFIREKKIKVSGDKLEIFIVKMLEFYSKERSEIKKLLEDEQK